jgi:AAA domain
MTQELKRGPSKASSSAPRIPTYESKITSPSSMNRALPAPIRCASFLRRLGPHDRVFLIGDTRQHQGVEAGRPFEQLQEAGMRTARPDEIVREKDLALKSAVELLAMGQVPAALDALQQQGRVKEIPMQKNASAPSQRLAPNRPRTFSSSHRTMLPAAS